MATDKIITLVQTLCEKTAVGRVEWYRVGASVFRAKLGEMTLQVSRSDSEEYPDMYDYRVSLFDANGDEIDGATDSQLLSLGMEKSYDVLEGLFQAARRIALDVDGKLDSTIERLLGL